MRYSFLHKVPYAKMHMVARGGPAWHLGRHILKGLFPLVKAGNCSIYKIFKKMFGNKYGEVQ